MGDWAWQIYTIEIMYKIDDQWQPSGYSTGNSTQASVVPRSSARPQYKTKSLKFEKKKKNQ